MKIHELKTWPEYFSAIIEGVKHFEYRYNDRDYQPGDILILEEYLPEEREYTGRSIKVFVPYLINVAKNYVIMSIEIKEINL